MWVGPKVIEAVNWQGYTILYYLRKRYGRGLETLMTIVTVMQSWLGQVADMTAITYCIDELSVGYPSVLATVATAMVTVLYTVIGGFRISVVTDQVQGAIIVVLVCVVVAALFISVVPELPAEDWSVANTWEPEGLMTGTVLIVSVFFVTFTDLAFWQKGFAANSVKDIQWGMVFGMVLTLPVIILFGSTGFILRAAEAAGFVTVHYASDGFFQLVSFLPMWLMVCVVFLTICLACSSLDSRVNSLSNILGPTLEHYNWDLNWSRLFGLVVNILAAIAAVYQPSSIMTMLFLGNIIGQITGPVIFLGLWPKATQAGAVVGIAAGFLSVFIMGWASIGTFIGGFQWFLFPWGWGNWQCLFTFLLGPAVTVIVAALVSLAQHYFDPTLQEKLDARIAALAGAEKSYEASSATTEKSTSSEEMSSFDV
ncbi:MAG: uncharacterized protein KVP18_003058 [Porospora cf. gigantea A]|uniref:uncharacterized protein n=1 Tax=Porospora cf. gigantea A TaxID=2853593 RepID=UPI003559F57B|nr:MAG: hypothetical protein KVP18_003058 [Porospora cf. gigantea A]